MSVDVKVSTAMAVFSFLLMTAPMPALAQGKSGSASTKNKQSRTPTASPATSAEATIVPSTSGTLYYGSWLDDASILEPGAAWFGLSTAYWSAEAGRQIDAPVMAAGLGISRRANVGGSIPFYHYHDDTGLSAKGLGNVDVYGKIVLADPAGRRGLGLALAPLAEFSSASDRRFSWALPLNIEARASSARFYGSLGFYSRGSVFATIAAEFPAGSRASVTGTFGETYAGGGDGHLSNLGGSIAFFAAPAASLFASIGKTLGGTSTGGISIGGGVSILVPRTHRTRKP